MIGWLDTHGAAVQAVATVILVCITIYYAWRTSAQVHETRRASQAGLLERLDVEYGSEDMSEALWTLRRWRNSHGDEFTAAFERLLSTEDENGDRLDFSRRRVSQYFQRVRVFCQLSLLEEKQVAEMHGAESFDFFLDYVEPLNEVVQRVRRIPPRPEIRNWFVQFRTRHFRTGATG